MTASLLAARVVIGAAALALTTLAALHVLKPDIHPSRTMISQYALGSHGWVMAVSFAAFGGASAALFAALQNPYRPHFYDAVFVIFFVAFRRGP